jgi:Rrf2 family protein
MLSQTSRYALHILGYLASRPADQVRGEDVAEATGVPANYLLKIMGQLRKAGLVEAKRGWHGGFKLRESALDRPLKDALVALDGLDSVEREDCAFGLPSCDAEHPCPLHAQWEEIRGRFLEMISGTRIRDLAIPRVDAERGPAAGDATS